MQVYQYHVFVCDQQKPEGVPCCSARGSAATIDALRAQVGKQGLLDRVQITVCGSLGLCERGPNIVVYPEGTWYSGVQPGDVAEIVESHFRNGRVVERLVNRDDAALRAEINTNRTRMMNALREKDASGALPDPLAQSIRGFQESRIILTAIELDVFTAAGNGGNAAAIAAKLGTDPRATEMLLNALVAIGLLTKQADLFENTPAGTRYLMAGGKDDQRAALMHTAHLWLTWSNLTASVRAGTAVKHDEIPARGDDWTEAFIAAMHRNASERAGLVVQTAGAEKARRVLDVGGGSGAYSIAFAKANPELQSEVFDLGPVTKIAERHIAAAGVQGRVRTRVGDLRTDHFGSGYDLAFVSAICHMLSPEENADLAKRCFEALAPGGRIVIQDFVLDATKTAPKMAALFALNMLVGTRAGSSYSEPEYVAWLQGAGFGGVECVRMPGPTALMIGTRP
jgi:(2Fe-2S) ferredoxin/predicted O-methyltransferase YrrM